MPERGHFLPRLLWVTLAALLLITAGIITLIWPHNPPLGLAAGGVFLGGISALIAWRRRDG